MVPLTGNKFLHTKATQTSKGGYALGDLVVVDGITVVSKVANNQTRPDPADQVHWDLYA